MQALSGLTVVTLEHAIAAPFATRQLADLGARVIKIERPGVGDLKAYDLMIQSESGFVSITGTPDEPSKAGLSIADIAAGMYAYSSILAALLQRRIDGQGRRIDISLLEAMAE